MIKGYVVITTDTQWSIKLDINKVSKSSVKVIIIQPFWLPLFRKGRKEGWYRPCTFVMMY